MANSLATFTMVPLLLLNDWVREHPWGGLVVVGSWMDPGLMAQIQSLIFAGKKMVTKRVDF